MAKFIDLFAGLGGFHVALKQLGHECVFASEINETLANLYRENFHLSPARDIRRVKVEDIPSFDILCAGFPCQPFSKAGKQNGMSDQKNGTLFDEIVRILAFHRPKNFILENVPYIAKHDNENTWRYIETKLRDELGYDIDQRIYSPHQFGIPQHRQRIFIVGDLDNLPNDRWPRLDLPKEFHVRDFLNKRPPKSSFIGKEEAGCIELWQEFVDRLPRNTPIPRFPIWAMEFGATYPYTKGKTPFALSVRELAQYRGSFGASLAGIKRRKKIYALMPNYSRTEQRKFPGWKERYISKNRAFYELHKARLEPVVRKIAEYESQSWQKLEWNVLSQSRNISEYLIQFRASGLRIKEPNFFPSLVCTRTQVPIIGWEMRYITKNEGAKLQSLGNISLPENETTCFKALGNAVNSKIVRLIGDKLLPNDGTCHEMIGAKQELVG